MTKLLPVLLLLLLHIERGPVPIYAADVENGKLLYQKNCAQCHGDSGDGKGVAAEHILPRPRDFTSGAYKIRSTPSGELPTDDDIHRAIAEGLPGSSMPAWKDALSKNEIRDLVAYIKIFSERFKDEKPSRVFKIEGPKKATSESMANGRKLYLELGCFQCHGQEGRADGPSAPTLTDDAGNPLKPADFHKGWNFRGGHRPEDIFRTFLTGLNGTPMPSSLDALGDNPEGLDKAWDLANYVHSLSRHVPNTSDAVRAQRLDGPLPDFPGDRAWGKAQPVDFLMIGQIAQEPRQFNPAIDHLALRGLYNDKEVVLLLEWDDRTRDLGREKGTYPDAIQIQVPWALIQDSQSGERPYFLEGDPDHPVSLWRWNAKSDQVRHWKTRGMLSSKEAVASGPILTSSSSYQDGRWQLLLKRSLAAPKEAGLSLEERTFVPIAFSAWDGGSGETETLRSVSTWAHLLLEPPRSNLIYAYPVGTFFVVGGLELWYFKKRRREKVAGTF